MKCPRCYAPALLYGGGGYWSDRPCVAGSPPTLLSGGCEAHAEGRIAALEERAMGTVAKIPPRYGEGERAHWRMGHAGLPLRK